MTAGNGTRRERRAAIKIEIFYFKDCPNYEEADRRLRVVVAELGQSADVIHVEVLDDTIAAQIRFPGSPTIRVDGKDVVPEETTGPYRLSCRVNSTSSGLAGVPDTETIRAAVRTNLG